MKGLIELFLSVVKGLDYYYDVKEVSIDIKFNGEMIKRCRALSSLDTIEVPSEIVENVPFSYDLTRYMESLTVRIIGEQRTEPKLRKSVYLILCEGKECDISLDTLTEYTEEAVTLPLKVNGEKVKIDFKGNIILGDRIIVRNGDDLVRGIFQSLDERKAYESLVYKLKVVKYVINSLCEAKGDFFTYYI